MRKRNVLFTVVFAAVLTMGGLVQAGVIAKYEFTGFNSSPTVIDANMSGSDYDMTCPTATSERGINGLAANGNPAPAFFGAANFGSDSYFHFSITSDIGYTYDVDDLTFDYKRDGVNAWTSYDVQYSLNGGAFSSIGSGSLSGTTYSTITADNGGIGLTGLSGETVFRIYVSDGVDATRLYNDNVTVNGSVVPEPATLGLVALFGGGVLFIRHKLAM